MKIIRQYLIKTIVQAVVLVLLLLTGLNFFILFVNELHYIGVGNYDLSEAFLFALMQLPLFTYQFFPFACLLGSLIGLGLLSSNSELTVMRSSGLSIGRIAGVVLLAAFYMLLIASLIGELGAPSLEHYATQRKTIMESGGNALPTAQGIWLREGKSFIHIDEILPKGDLQGLRSYSFNENLELVKSLYARQAHYQDKNWNLSDVDINYMNSTGVETKHYLTYQSWPLKLRPSLLRLATAEPNQMSLRMLWRFIRSHQKSYSDVRQYQLTFWSRLLQPIATCVMMLLAIPFVFGSQRHSTLGTRLVFGIVIGFSFYILNEFFGPISLVLHFPPFLAAAMPTLIFALFGIWLMRKTR